MKTQELKQLIRKEVKSAIHEGLKEVLTEAVKEASKVEKPKQSEKQNNTQYLRSEKNKSIEESQNPRSVQDILDTTREEMEQNLKEYNQPNVKENVTLGENYGESGEAPKAGLDLSNLDFVKKANQVYRKSQEKSRG